MALLTREGNFDPEGRVVGPGEGLPTAEILEGLDLEALSIRGHRVANIPSRDDAVVRWYDREVMPSQTADELEQVITHGSNHLRMLRDSGLQHMPAQRFVLSNTVESGEVAGIPISKLFVITEKLKGDVLPWKLEGTPFAEPSQEAIAAHARYLSRIISKRSMLHMYMFDAPRFDQHMGTLDQSLSQKPLVQFHDLGFHFAGIQEQLDADQGTIYENADNLVTWSNNTGLERPASLTHLLEQLSDYNDAYADKYDLLLEEDNLA